MGRKVPGGGRDFFDISKNIKYCRYVLHIMAATSISRRICYDVRGVIDCQKAKRSGGFEIKAAEIMIGA